MSQNCEKIQQLNQQAWSNRNKDVQESLLQAQQAQAMLAECPDIDQRELAISLCTQAYCLDYLNRYSEALTISMTAMELAVQLGDLKIIANLDNVLGGIYWRLSDYSSSLEHYMHGLELIKIEPDPELEVFLIQGLGILHYAMGSYEEALKFFKRSIELVETKDMIGRAIGLNNIAFTLHRMNRDQEALEYAQKALQLFDRNSFSVGKLEALHTLGAVYLGLDDIDRAAQFFEDALEAASLQENRLQMVNALLGICQVHQLRGELDLAQQKLIQVLQISKDINSLTSECDAQEQLTSLYKRMGNYRAALEHYELFYSLQMRLLDEKSERRLQNAQLLLELESIRKQANLYRTLAATDALTGLLSRREFFELGVKLIRQAQQKRTPVALLMVDLDFFKPVNDQYGHAVGDQVLSMVAQRLKNALRQDDLAGRYGGDEFAILMPEIGLAGCLKIARRCQQAVAEQRVEINSITLQMNISIGLAVLDAGSILTLEELIEHADQALLIAKRNGRNRIVSSGIH